MIKNKICELFNIKHSIVQAGMIWTSGWRLAAAAANAGCLGLIGAGSMYPDVLREHIRKCKNATSKSFGVNLPLMYADIDKHIQIIIEEGVKIVFTSGGNPKLWTKFLREKGIIVAHVVPSAKFALKAVDAGVDAVVAEGFEAGGHNGREEITTFCLIPQVRKVLKIPVIAAGGIATGRGMLAAMALGADGVQMGTRFAMSQESSWHPEVKKKATELNEDSTMLALKKLSPTRMVKNKFYEQVKEAEDKGASAEELQKILGRARAKLGMFEGNLDEGELEIGQISSLLKEIRSVDEIVKEIIAEFAEARNELANMRMSE